MFMSVCARSSLYLWRFGIKLCCEGYKVEFDDFHDGLPGHDGIKKRWSAMEEFGGKTYLPRAFQRHTQI